MLWWSWRCYAISRRQRQSWYWRSATTKEEDCMVRRQLLFFLQNVSAKEATSEKRSSRHWWVGRNLLQKCTKCKPQKYLDKTVLHRRRTEKDNNGCQLQTTADSGGRCADQLSTIRRRKSNTFSKWRGRLQTNQSREKRRKTTKFGNMEDTHTSNRLEVLSTPKMKTRTTWISLQTSVS